MKKKFLIYLILIIGIILFAYSSFKLYRWWIDSNNTAKNIDKIKSIISVNTNSYDFSNENKNSGIDLSEFKAINPDTIGWIKVNGTNVDYPFVQTVDNNFYLKHTFDRSYNEAGWVFLDFRNNLDEFNKNTILYAHGRLDETMFGSLDNVFDQEWLSDTNNHKISLSTETQTTTWQIFSVYHISTTSDYIQTEFESDLEFTKFAEKLKSRSVYDFKTTVSESDKILTLSTCYKNNSKERLVVHAKREFQ